MVNKQTSKGDMALAQRKMNRMLDRVPARIAVIEEQSHSNIVSYVVKKGCTARTFSPDAVKEVEAWGADGFIFTGNSKGISIREHLQTRQQLVLLLKGAGVPVLGIGLGHQLLAFSEGIKGSIEQGSLRQKLPVKNRLTGKLEIKDLKGAGYLRLPSGEQSKVEVTHININDQNAEGVQYKRFPGFSVQYVPTSTDYLFNHFIDLVQMRVFKRRAASVAAGSPLRCSG